MKKLIDITPRKLSCALLTCPSVFETDKGTFLIIGNKLDNENIPNKVRKKIGNDEIVIEVPRNLITDLDLFKGK